MVYVNTTFYQFNTSKTVDATPTFLSPHVTGSVSSQGGHFGRKPREERVSAGATMGWLQATKGACESSLGKYHPTDGAIIVNKNVETCSKILWD